MLGGDPVVSEPDRLAQRPFERLLGPGREGDAAVIRQAHLEGLARLPAYLLQRDPDGRERLGERRLCLLAHRFRGDAHRRERLRGYPLAGAQDAEQQVFVPYGVVAEEPRLLKRGLDAPPRFLGETVEDHAPFPFLPLLGYPNRRAVGRVR
jgi:hypothetical protein